MQQYGKSSLFRVFFLISLTTFIEDEGNCLISLPVVLIINPIAKTQWIGSFLKQHFLLLPDRKIHAFILIVSSKMCF